MTWYNISWNYRKSITISNSGSTLTDYQVSIGVDTANLITSSKLRSDCGDIRFTQNDGTTLINYWIESGINSSSTKIWVKIPSISAGINTIYMYYGNSSATSLSDGTNTFIFFDDFSGNLSKWTTGGTPTIVSGILTLDANGDTVQSTSNFGFGTAFRSLTKFTTPSGSSEEQGYGTNLSSYLYWQIYVPWSGTNLITRKADDSYTASNLAFGSWQTLEIVRLNATSHSFYANDTFIKTYTTNDPTTNRPITASVQIAGTGKQEIDWTLVRKYSSPEPTTCVGGEEVKTVSWLTNWNRRRLMTITGSTSSSQTDYQMKIIVHKSSGTDTSTDIYIGTNVKDDFSDLRFTYNDGTTLLNYWIESYTSGSVATVWIKIPSIPISPCTTTIYAYYNNSGATTISNYINTLNILGNGSSGSLTVSSLNTIVNTYTYLTNNVNSGGTSLSISSGTGFSNGDEILIIQMQGYSGGTVGSYEFKKILSGGGTTTLTIDSTLKNSYKSGTFDSTTATSTQIVKIPQYTNVTINNGASLTCNTWDGYKGGILALRANGIFTNNGIVDVSGKGYRGGLVNVASGYSGQAGESYNGLGGTGVIVTNLGAGASGYQNSANGGINGGGGGASYGTLGTASSDTNAPAGSIYGINTLDNIILGSGGGAPGNVNAGNATGCVAYNGSPGGGITLIYANNISMVGPLNAKGNNGTAGSGSNHSWNGAGSGAGSGGSVYLIGDSLTVGTYVNASGGTGGGSQYGYSGGNGGKGRVRLTYNTLTGTTDPVAYTTGIDIQHNRSYTSPEPSFSTTGTEETPSNITATSMTITPNETPCRHNICTVTVSVTWTNNGGSSGSFAPNITIDTVAIDPAPYPSQELAPTASVTKTFIVSNLAVGTRNICPYPN